MLEVMFKKKIKGGYEADTYESEFTTKGQLVRWGTLSIDTEIHNCAIVMTEDRLLHEVRIEHLKIV